VGNTNRWTTPSLRARPGLPERIARRFRHPSPRAAVGVAARVIMTVLPVSIGLLLTKLLLDGALGRWDDSINLWSRTQDADVR
jgi:hypothetical protein